MIGTLPIGGSASFPFTQYLPDLVTPSPDFRADDVLAGYLWAGDDQTAVANPIPEWVDATVGQWRLNFVPDDTLLLGPGVYRVRVTAARGLDLVELLRDSIELTVIPAAGVPPLVYCTYEDMAAECTWIKQFQDTDEDQTGFAEQRAKARQWMDGLILRAAPVSGPGVLISTQNYWTWGTSGSSFAGGYSLASDPTLAGYLSNNQLVMAGPGGAAITRACACYAIALVLRAQPGGENAKMAGYYMRVAHSEASNIVAEIDIDGTGRAGVAIALGVTNSRSA